MFVQLISDISVLSTSNSRSKSLALASISLVSPVRCSSKYHKRGDWLHHKKHTERTKITSLHAKWMTCWHIWHVLLKTFGTGWGTISIARFRWQSHTRHIAWSGGLPRRIGEGVIANAVRSSGFSGLETQKNICHDPTPKLQNHTQTKALWCTTLSDTFSGTGLPGMPS